MQDFIDFEYNYRFFTEKENEELLFLVAAKVKEHILSNDEIVEVLKDVDAEVSHDVLKILLHQKYITNDDYNEIDKALIAVYEKEFILDVENHNIEKRMRFQKNSNARLISRYEILGIYYSKTLDSKALFGIEKSEDEIVNLLAEKHKELCLPRIANRLEKIQKERLKETLEKVIDKIENLNKKIL